MNKLNNMDLVVLFYFVSDSTLRKRRDIFYCPYVNKSSVFLLGITIFMERRFQKRIIIITNNKSK